MNEIVTLIIGSMEYHKIDAIFKHDGHEYRVVDPCRLCDFYYKYGTYAGKYCDRDSREDGVDLRFLLSILFGIKVPIEKKETESNSYARKMCKSCDWYSHTQSMCNRYDRSTKPLDPACPKYLNRYHRGK